MSNLAGEHVAICPGTFDPITNGHVDIITRAASIFGRVIVSVSGNSGKAPLFSSEERLEFARSACAHISNVDVGYFEGLVVDYARERGAHTIVKGLRVVSDFEREMTMAHMNRALAEEIPTIFLMTHADHAFLSSSLVKEVISLGGDVSTFVPGAVEKALRKKLALE